MPNSHDLGELLERLHQLSVQQLLDILEAEPEDPYDLEAVQALRQRQHYARQQALTLLKQNGITAAVTPGSRMGSIVSKLDFSDLPENVRPLRNPLSGPPAPGAAEG